MGDRGRRASGAWEDKPIAGALGNVANRMRQLDVQPENDELKPSPIPTFLGPKVRGLTVQQFNKLKHLRSTGC